MIRAVDTFTLDTADVDRTATSTLVMAGRPVGRVDGRKIDAQLAVPGGFLVLVSYGEIFSAMETACFVDPAGRMRDRVTLGHATEQGLITEIAVDGPDAITFAFPMNERRRLRVGREARWLGLRERWLHLEP